MPIAAVVECVSERGSLRLDQLRGRGLHGAFLEAVRRVSPEMSEILHEGSLARPYCLGAPGRWAEVPSAQHFRFRAVLLQESLYPLLVKLAQATHEEPLIIGDNHFRVQSVLTGASASVPWTGASSWVELWEEAKPFHDIVLELATPTSFRWASKDRPVPLEQPLPLPHLVLGSALTTWERWSGFSFDPALRTILETHLEVCIPLEIRAHSVEMQFASEKHERTTRRFTGVTGTIAYRIHEQRLSEEQLKQINALANSLFFTGAGQKTTMGMGMVRRISGKRARTRQTRTVRKRSASERR